MTLQEVVRNLKPLSELVALSRIAMKNGTISLMELSDFDSVSTPGEWVTNFAIATADKSALAMFPEDERLKRSCVPLLFLDAPVDRWFKEFIRFT